MRRTVAPLVAFGLGAALLVASPALASFQAFVELPSSEVYSPYGGPISVTFLFEPDDSASVFTIRLRRPGDGTIKEKDVLVNPATQTSPHDVAFSWKERSAGSPTDYVVDVRRQSGGPVITSETFTLLPPLVSDLTATPTPFYPLVDDGYRDDTSIRFDLAGDTVDTVVHVFADDQYGRCCGTEIRTADLGPLAAGTHGWTWDGAKDDTSAAPKGRYFARIAATDTDAVSMISKPLEVEIDKGLIRLKATIEKRGRSYGGVTGEVQTAIGGDCAVSRSTTSDVANINCANANITVFWKWKLAPNERIESVSFAIDGSFYGCRRNVSHTRNRSFLHVLTPPTSTCVVSEARITYSYPVQA